MKGDSAVDNEELRIFQLYKYNPFREAFHRMETEAQNKQFVYTIPTNTYIQIINKTKGLLHFFLGGGFMTWRQSTAIKPPFAMSRKIYL